MPRIKLNGTETEIQDNLNLQEALEIWNYSGGKCAIAINTEFVPRTDYSETVLRSGDEVEVVVAVGGG